MNWQDYQNAVCELYETLDGVGVVHKNITRKDRITGQPRQIDALLEYSLKSHSISILIDAKYRDGCVDVKDVEEVLALADAVGANKAVIVTNNGWTKPAKKKADFLGFDLRILSLEDAINLLGVDMLQICPHCQNDCVIPDLGGAAENAGAWFWWIAGRCRECKAIVAWCQECGEKLIVPASKESNCGCGHAWINTAESLRIQFKEDLPD